MDYGNAALNYQDTLWDRIFKAKIFVGTSKSMKSITKILGNTV